MYLNISNRKIYIEHCIYFNYQIEIEVCSKTSNLCYKMYAENKKNRIAIVASSGNMEFSTIN